MTTDCGGLYFMFLVPLLRPPSKYHVKINTLEWPYKGGGHSELRLGSLMRCSNRKEEVTAQQNEHGKPFLVYCKWKDVLSLKSQEGGRIIYNPNSYMSLV